MQKVKKKKKVIYMSLRGKMFKSSQYEFQYAMNVFAYK